MILRCAVRVTSVASSSPRAMRPNSRTKVQLRQPSPKVHTGFGSGHPHLSAGGNLVKTREHMCAILGTLMLALSGLVGCSSSGPQPATHQASCEISVDAVCASAIGNYFAEHTERPVQVGPAKNSMLLPFVAPVKMPSGEVAAEVDCYTSIGSDGSWWLVYAHVAMPPRSQSAAKRLRDQELCIDVPTERMLATRAKSDGSNVHTSDWRARRESNPQPSDPKFH
jgi:hypothetical protein